MRLLMLCNGTASQGTARLFESLSARLTAQGHVVDLQLRDFPRGVGPKLWVLVRTEWRNCRRIWRCDALIVHTALSLSLVSILMARLARRPVVAFVWDFYPESTIVMGNIRNPGLLAAYRWTERLAYLLASRLLVPSDDYVNALTIGRGKSTVFPLWTSDPTQEGRECRLDEGDLHVIFAGQVNAIRGLDDAIHGILDALADRGLTFHLYSRDPAPESIRVLASGQTALTLEEHGFVAPEVLQEDMALMHFGLVSIDEGFDLPAFPSKLMSYLAAGTPVLYSGRQMPALEETLCGNGIGVSLNRQGLSDAELAPFFADYLGHRARFTAALERDWSRFDQLF